MNKAGGQFPPNFCPSGRAAIDVLYSHAQLPLLSYVELSSLQSFFAVRNLHCFVQLAVRPPPNPTFDRGFDDRPKQHDVFTPPYNQIIA